MAQVHERVTASPTRPGVIRIVFGDPGAPAQEVEVSTEAAERLAQDLQQVLTRLGNNPAAP